MRRTKRNTKKRILAILTVVVMTFALAPFMTVAAQPSVEGDGTESYPYLVANETELREVLDYIDGGDGDFIRITGDFSISGDPISIEDPITLIAGPGGATITRVGEGPHFELEHNLTLGDGIRLVGGGVSGDDALIIEGSVVIDGIISADVEIGNQFSDNETESLTVPENSTLTFSSGIDVSIMGEGTLNVNGTLVNNGTVTIEDDGSIVIGPAGFLTGSGTITGDPPLALVIGARITDVPPPVVGETPVTVDELPEQTGNFNITGIVWTQNPVVEGEFQAETVYTVSITITPNPAGFAFSAANGFDGRINGNENTVVTAGTDGAVVLTLTFPATDEDEEEDAADDDDDDTAVAAAYSGIPVTGDENNIALWITILAGSGAATAILTTVLLKRRTG